MQERFDQRGDDKMVLQGGCEERIILILLPGPDGSEIIKCRLERLKGFAHLVKPLMTLFSVLRKSSNFAWKIQSPNTSIHV
jgi:hypothetical protein